MKMYSLKNRNGYNATYIAENLDKALALAVEAGHARKTENLKSSLTPIITDAQTKLLEVCEQRGIEGALVTRLNGTISTPIVGGVDIIECQTTYGTPEPTSADLISILKGSIV